MNITQKMEVSVLGRHSPQVTPNQSRRHHSPRGNRWCVDDELLDLVLQMIVSPTLNSLSQIWIWWKDDLSGKQLGEG